MDWDGVARVDGLDDWFREVAVEPARRVIYPAHGESPMAADIVPAMADAMALVRGGREPDVVADAVATHTFAGFQILVNWAAASEASS